LIPVLGQGTWHLGERLERRSEEIAGDNHGALGITLSPHDLDEIDRAFPPPKGPRPLEVI
jgi:hypothetical protein